MTSPAPIPKLSVLMISYNHEPYIARALESALAQKTNFDFEIVAGEDCSSDQTRKILLDYAARHPGKIVPLLREKNIGGCANLEDTLRHCRGEYVALLETDDFWTDSRKLQIQADFLDAHRECALCCHRVQVVYELGSADAIISPTLPAGNYGITDLFRENFIPSCSAVFRHKQNGVLPEDLKDVSPGDWARWMLIAQHGSIALLDETMATYRVYSGGMWSSATPLSRLRDTEQMLRRLNKHSGYKYSQALRLKQLEIHFELAQRVRDSRQRSQTGKEVFELLARGGLKRPEIRRAIGSCTGYFLFGSLWFSTARARRAWLG